MSNVEEFPGFSLHLGKRTILWGGIVGVGCRTWRSFQDSAFILANGRFYGAELLVLDVERGGVSRIQPSSWQTDDSMGRNCWCWMSNVEEFPGFSLHLGKRTILWGG